MSFTKTFILSLAMNWVFSSVLCASSLQEEQYNQSKKILKTSKKQRESASALIRKYQNSPTPPSETELPNKSCRVDFSRMIYITPQGQVVHTE